MTYQIQPYTEDKVSDVKAFNQRLRTGNASFVFPETHISDRWPRVDDGRNLYEDYFLVVENGLHVRGGYILKSQNFHVNGEVMKIGNIQLPLSEGSVDKSHNIVGIKIVKDAIKKNPYLYALGMGGEDKPFPLLLKSLGWETTKITFYFKILHPKSFFSNIAILRKNRMLSFVLDIFAHSGIGYMGLKAYNLLKLRYKSKEKKVICTEIPRFNKWVNDIWEREKNNYTFCAVRDSKTLNILYPEENEKMIRLKFTKDDINIGWLLVLVSQMSNHKHFGNMKVGSIIDGQIIKGKTSNVIKSAISFFAKKKVDLIVSNQSYFEFDKAFINNGFIKGPSNFIFAISRKLSKKLDISKNSFSYRNVHINRGDGDGPMHL